METQMLIGVGAMLAMSMGIIGIMRVAANAAFPARERLYVLSVELINEGRISDTQRLILERMMERALSFAEGWLLVRAAWRALGSAMRGEKRSDLHRRIVSRLDARFIEATRCFIISVAAANPLAIIISAPVVVAAFAIEKHAANVKALAGYILLNPRAI